MSCSDDTRIRSVGGGSVLRYLPAAGRPRGVWGYMGRDMGIRWRMYDMCTRRRHMTLACLQQDPRALAMRLDQAARHGKNSSASNEPLSSTVRAAILLFFLLRKIMNYYALCRALCSVVCCLQNIPNTYREHKVASLTRISTNFNTQVTKLFSRNN